MADIQEDLSAKTVKVTFKTAELSAKILKNVFKKTLKRLGDSADSVSRDMEYRSSLGRQESVKALNRDGDSLKSLEMPEKVSLKTLDRMARGYGVKFAVNKEREGGSMKYTMFFKAKDIDTIRAMMKEYAGQEIRPERAPVREQIKLAKEKQAGMERERPVQKERKRSKEADLGI